MNELIILGAKYLIYAVALIAVALIVWDKELRVRLGILLVLALPLGYVLARLVGHFYSHPQPFAVLGFEPLVAHTVDNSFPSDHTLAAGIFASVVYISNRRVGLGLWVLALLVGLSRMLAGLHWGIDVLASVVLAVVIVFILNQTLKLIFSW